MSDSFDYVIVGAGSAGCTLAYRLTEDPALRVLVLEAGGWDKDFWLHIPLAWGRNVLQRRKDWMYSSEPEPGTGNRRIPINRGKVIGGSSSINGLAYVRGHRGDYDRWASGGLSQWSYAHVLPYFRRSENWEGGASAYRGGDGPLGTIFPQSDDPINDAIIEAGKLAGFPFTEDYNGAQQEGFCRAQSTIKNGRRCSAAVAYLHPALARGNNLTVEVEAQAFAHPVRRLACRRHRVRAARRDQDRARRARSDPGRRRDQFAAAADAVGHRRRRGAEAPRHRGQAAPAAYRQESAGPYGRRGRCDPHRAGAVAKGVAAGSDRAASARARISSAAARPATVMNNVQAYLKSDPSEKMPDVQFLFRVAPLDAGALSAAVQAAFRRRLWLPRRGAAARKPRPARARLGRSARADPHRAEFLLARQGPQSHPRRACAWRARSWPRRRCGASAASNPCPGRTRSSDAELNDYIRATATTVYHPLGTCKMGGERDETAVVDPELKLRGIDGVARGRCLGDAGSRRRQHQRARDHDRRKSRRHDPRQAAARAGECVKS